MRQTYFEFLGRSCIRRRLRAVPTSVFSKLPISLSHLSRILPPMGICEADKFWVGSEGYEWLKRINPALRDFCLVASEWSSHSTLFDTDLKSPDLKETHQLPLLTPC
ncbi:hypothetical protein B0H13DRAFT_1890216 [Mycena leptocephala]|nr:hypothetical protein B0H13DRAFT_1890216 [Mycena leptocephala]